MIFYSTRLLMTGIIIGMVISTLSNDYVLISRRKYEKLKRKREED